MTDLLKRLDSLWGVLTVIAALFGLHLTILCPWMNHWGVSPSEAAMALPGDHTEPGLTMSSTRGVTVRAPASTVWQWLVQMGQNQAGFYSNDWLENLVFADIHNQDRIHPEWQSHSEGEHILGAGGALYGSAQFWPTLAYEEGRMLYLWGPIVVFPVDANTSRLLARTYGGPPSLLEQFSYDWIHFVMERGMLLGIQARAEGKPTTPPVLHALGNMGWIVAAAGIGVSLFRRRRGWHWGLIPLAYAIAIFVLTRDLWSALAGFSWWGVIAGGFLLFGRAWWRRLALATALVLLIMILAPQPHPTFGVSFLVIALGWAANSVLVPTAKSAS